MNLDKINPKNLKRKNTDNDENNNDNEENQKNKTKIIRYDTFDDFIKDIMSNELGKNGKNDLNPELINDFSESRDEESDEESEEEIELEYEHIKEEVNTLDDLIKLGKKYEKTKKYNIDMKTLNKLVEPLEELKMMIGMRSVKINIVNHIIFYLQKLDEGKLDDMLHTVIQGPPGVGKQN